MTTPHDYSLNETASRARLAAKGIGYSWGLADEVSRCVFWLSRRRIPAMELLTGLFLQVQSLGGVERIKPESIGYTDISNGSWLCPIICGCAITDWYQSIDNDETIVIKNLKYPFLIVPFIAELASRSNKTLVLSIADETIITDGENIISSHESLLTIDHAGQVDCRVANANETSFGGAGSAAMCNRVVIAAEHWSALGGYAHNTYAPATEASRLAGAGAGVTDND